MRRSSRSRVEGRSTLEYSLALGSSLPLALCLVMIVCGIAPAADDPAGVAFFESKIRPVLVECCQECHSSTLKKPKGDLRLDTREGVRKGGRSGPAVVPGDLESSVLFQAITTRQKAIGSEGPRA